MRTRATPSDERDRDPEPDPTPVPGRIRLPSDGIVRCKLVAGSAPSSDRIEELATEGTRSAGGGLPYGDVIQAAFGRHRIDNIQTHTGRDATRTADEMGAEAYAVGDHVVLGERTSVHTVAHEAAHVIQQRAGVHCKRSGGDPGDPDERMADEVADRVVAGRSAEDLLDSIAGGGGAPSVQRKVKLVKEQTVLAAADDFADVGKLSSDEKSALDRVCKADDYELEFSDGAHVIAWLRGGTKVLPRKSPLGRAAPVAAPRHDNSSKDKDGGSKDEEVDEGSKDDDTTSSFQIREHFAHQRRGSFDRQTSTGFLHVPTKSSHEQLQKNAGTHLATVKKEKHVSGDSTKSLVTSGANAIAMGIDIQYQLGTGPMGTWQTVIDRVWNSGTHQHRELEGQPVAQDVTSDIDTFLAKMTAKQDNDETIFKGAIPKTVGEKSEQFAHSEVAAAADPELDGKLEHAVQQFVAAVHTDQSQMLNVREILLNVASNPNAMCGNLCADALQDIKHRLWAKVQQHLQGTPQVTLKAPGADQVVSGLREFGPADTKSVWQGKLDDARLPPEKQLFPSHPLVLPDETVSIETQLGVKTDDKAKKKKGKSKGGVKGQITKALRSHKKPCASNEAVYQVASTNADALAVSLQAYQKDGITDDEYDKIRDVLEGYGVRASDTAIDGVLVMLSDHQPAKKQRTTGGKDTLVQDSM